MLDQIERTAQSAQSVATTGIAILGSHPATVEQAPFDDPSWRIYACSPHNFEVRRLPRFDQWFEVHDPIEDGTRPFAYLQYVSSLPLVWMRDQRALASGCFKGARPYPEQELRGGDIRLPDGNIIPDCKGLFSPFSFTSSIAYMLAKAIVDCEADGIKRIGLWGIMQAHPTEYTYQKPGIQNLIYEATRRGIKVLAPRESGLFDAPKEKW